MASCAAAAVAWIAAPTDGVCQGPRCWVATSEPRNAGARHAAHLRQERHPPGLPPSSQHPGRRRPRSLTASTAASPWRHIQRPCPIQAWDKACRQARGCQGSVGIACIVGVVAHQQHGGSTWHGTHCNHAAHTSAGGGCRRRPSHGWTLLVRTSEQLIRACTPAGEAGAVSHRRRGGHGG